MPDADEEMQEDDSKETNAAEAQEESDRENPELPLNGTCDMKEQSQASIEFATVKPFSEREPETERTPSKKFVLGKRKQIAGSKLSDSLKKQKT